MEVNRMLRIIKELREEHNVIKSVYEKYKDIYIKIGTDWYKRGENEWYSTSVVGKEIRSILSAEMEGCVNYACYRVREGRKGSELEERIMENRIKWIRKEHVDGMVEECEGYFISSSLPKEEE